MLRLGDFTASNLCLTLWQNAGNSAGLPRTSGMKRLSRLSSADRFSSSSVSMPQSAWDGDDSSSSKWPESSIIPYCSRWIRYRARDEPPPSLENFVQRDDAHLYDHNSSLACLIDQAEIRLVNQTSSIQRLHETLKDLDLVNVQRLRPNWDEYFMQLASLAAHRSNCMKRRVGCVLVREKRVISTGYNGTPRNLTNCNQGGCENRSFLFR